MKYTILGVGNLKKALERVKASQNKKIDALLQGAALRTVAVAKSRLQPNGEDGKDVVNDIVSVRQSINHTYDPEKKVAMVFAGNTKDDHMAAYLEFGTGEFAARYVPSLGSPYWSKLAMQFYKNGKGTLREHPFLIPAYKQEREILKGKLKKLKVSW